jgi:predicted nucleic acid-binding protein
LFADSSFWFAAIVARDRNNARAGEILFESPELTTSNFVLVETWTLLASRYRRDVADTFWDAIRRGAAHLEWISPADLEAAWTIGEIFADQDFSLVDRTSFALMERLGITRVASFDDDFAIYRYGRGREKAFEVIR